MSIHVQSQLIIRKGELVTCHGTEYVITHIHELDKVIARNLQNQNIEVLEVRFLKPVIPEGAEEPDRDLLDVSEKDWEYARNALKLIGPLLKRQKHGTALVDKIAAQAGVSRSTLYRWLRYYSNTGLLSSLLPTRSSGGRGKGRLQAEVEVIIEDRIMNYYLTDQQPTVEAVAEEIRRLCSNAGLPLPHVHTIRARVSRIQAREHMEKRKGRRAAIQRYEPNEGTIPNADWPLALVQIDHTKLDIMIVDEEHRRVIGRPWITLGIDLNSRVIPGMHLTLEAPSAMSAGMCIAHAILGKEKWLEDKGEKVEWPVWGVMGILHMDNAREFRGEMLKLACNDYGIDLMLRPVKTPHYGGHIERLMGTFATELKKLPGATFSNPKERGEYDSEGKAIMTLPELEKWLINFIAKYHNRVHGGIGTTPLKKYMEGLLGKDGKAPRGLPARRLDEEKIRIDFMPIVERTIQSYGVLIDDIHYFADVLRPWVGSPDPDNPKASRLFRFRRNPHDISELYFFDPNLKRYFAIPYRNISLPPISLQELRAARAAARTTGQGDSDERTIFAFVNRQREIQDEAALKTKHARKQKQRRADNDKVRRDKKKELPKTTQTAAPALPPKLPGYDNSRKKHFDDEY